MCYKYWAYRFNCKFHITTLSNGTSAIKCWMISIWNGEKLNCTESLSSSHDIITLELNNINIVLRCSNSKWTGWKLNRSRRKNRRKEIKTRTKTKCLSFWMNNVWNVQMKTRWSGTFAMAVYLCWLFFFFCICQRHLWKSFVQNATHSSEWRVEWTEPEWYMNLVV